MARIIGQPAVKRLTLQCPDCWAYMEDWGDRGLRCSWTSSSRGQRTVVAGILALRCDWPYAGARSELAAPITGRVAR